MEKITSVAGRMVLDSKGNPAVEAVVSTRHYTARAIAPSGASPGAHEAVDLRDKGKAFLGMGVKKAVENVNGVIAKKLKGMDAARQGDIDGKLIELDSTTNKSKLGTNAVCAASMACCKCGAMAKGKKLYEHIAGLGGNNEIMLPVPLVNVLNGGMHAGNNLSTQEFMLFPSKAESYTEALEICAETYQMLRTVIRDKFGKHAINVGDGGGFAPPLNSSEDAIKIVQLSLKELGYGKKAEIALDFAASRFHKNNSYEFEGQNYSNLKFVERVEEIVDRHKIASAEDPFAEDDWQGFCALTKARGGKVQVVGDELLVSKVDRIKRAAKLNACTAVVIKLNQVGTITEALDAIIAAKEKGLKPIMSHRSGESEDSFIADFAVGAGCRQAKFGAPARGERTAKYNQLLRIDEDLGTKAKYAGKTTGN